MSRAKTSSDANPSAPEFARLTFPDVGALEREIAANLRFGQVFVRELLKFPVLTDGVIVIVHPLSQRELRLPAQIVMVKGDGPQRGTGLALRAFGRAELEQLEAFAREPGAASPPPRARSQSSTTTTAAGARAGREAEPAPAAPSTKPASQPSAAGPRAHMSPSGVQRLNLQPTAAERAADATAGRPRVPSSSANPAVRRPAREVDATPARTRSSANISAQRPAQEVDGRSAERVEKTPQPMAARARGHSPVPRPAQAIQRTEVESERAERPRTASRTTQAAVQPMAAAPVAPARAEEDDWSDFEHGPEPGAVIPTPVVAAPGPVPALTNVEDDDWSDFEHGPEPSAPTAPPPPEAAELAAEADSLSIPYDLESARDRVPSAAFVSSPHTAVTHRPPPKDTPEPPPDQPRKRG